MSEKSLGQVQFKRVDSLQFIKMILLGTDQKYCGNFLKELRLLYNKDDKQDVQQLKKILQIIRYPSTEYAEVHMKANRLGALDMSQQDRKLYGLEQTVKKKEEEQQDKGQQKKQQAIMEKNICQCCGFLLQSNKLPYSIPLQRVKNIGISTYLYFLKIKYLAFTFLLIGSLLFAMGGYKNIDTKGESNIQSYSQASYIFQKRFWLSSFILFIWLFIYIAVRSQQKYSQFKIDNQSITAADFTLLFKNLPKNITKQQLEVQLQDYQLKNKNLIPHLSDKIVQIQKIQKIMPYFVYEKRFRTNQIKNIMNKFQKTYKKIVKILLQRQKQPVFTLSKNQRQNLYQQLENLRKQKKIQIAKARLQNIQSQNTKKQKQTIFRPMFVTFKSIHNKNLIQKLNEQQSYSQIYKLPKKKHIHKFHYNYNQKSIEAIIEPAPEPEDIIWQNLGLSRWAKMKKKLITYMVTLATLYMSCLVIYKLSIIKKQHMIHRKQQHNMIAQRLISLTMSLTNIMIQQILRFLTSLQKNETKTHEQMNMAIKGIFAVMINSIAMPIVVNQLLGEEIYGQYGLAQDILNFSITNALVNPILKIVNVNFVKTRIIKWYYSRPYMKLQLKQKKLNQLSQFPVFQIGYQYIYIVNLYLFTCFFLALNPYILIPAICSLVILYFTQKFALFHCYRRPTPGDNSVHIAMTKFILLGPLFFAAGVVIWSDNPYTFLYAHQFKLFLNLILAFSIIFLPYNKISMYICPQKQQEQAIYEQHKSKLPTSYDRFNPVTSKKAIIMHKQSLEQKSISQKQKYLNEHPEQYNQLFQKFSQQKQKLKQIQQKQRILNEQTLIEQSHKIQQIENKMLQVKSKKQD